jgi:hypothetical protein
MYFYRIWIVTGFISFNVEFLTDALIMLNEEYLYLCFVRILKQYIQRIVLEVYVIYGFYDAMS